VVPIDEARRRACGREEKITSLTEPAMIPALIVDSMKAPGAAAMDAVAIATDGDEFGA